MTAFPKQHHIKNKLYRKSFDGETCWSCDCCDGSIIGAHIRWNEFSGTGRKPSDDLIIPLCASCHMEQESNPGPEWWTQNVLKKLARDRYRKNNK